MCAILSNLPLLSWVKQQNISIILSQCPLNYSKDNFKLCFYFWMHIKPSEYDGESQAGLNYDVQRGMGALWLDNPCMKSLDFIFLLNRGNRHQVNIHPDLWLHYSLLMCPSSGLSVFNKQLFEDSTHSSEHAEEAGTRMSRRGVLCVCAPSGMCVCLLWDGSATGFD